MADLARDQAGRMQAQLLNLVPGRSGTAYATWLAARATGFTTGIEVATLDPFHGHKNAIDDEIDDATALLDAFHVDELATGALDEARRRVPQDTLATAAGPATRCMGSAPSCAVPPRRLSPRRWDRLSTAIAVDGRPEQIFLSWQISRRFRSTYHASDLVQGRHIVEKLLASLPSCPIPEVARFGRTLRKWRLAFLVYCDTDRSNNGGTEAINGLIELHRRLASGYRNRENYCLRMLLAAGGLHPRADT